jgi:hypothetical protein
LGQVNQTSNRKNVNFGIRNGNFVTGYVEPTEVLDASRPFDTLISGLGWLVRKGKSYILESLDPNDDAEGKFFSYMHDVPPSLPYRIQKFQY